MSSALNADKSFPNKVVLHEHNKPTMGTSYVGPKTRIIVKRNMILKEKSKETESTLLDKKIRKYDRAPVRSKTQQISRENSNIAEKKNISKSSKSEKGLLKKSNLSKTSGLNDRNLSNSNDVNDIVSERNTNESDIITTENLSNDCDSGLMNLLSDAETHINGPQNSDETCKHNDIDKSVSKLGLELSHTSVSSIQNDVGTQLQHVLENSSSNMLHIENCESENKEYTFMNVTPATSGIRRQTSLKKSIPKPQSVILDSCDDSQHKNFEISDANKDIFHITNSSDLMHHNCNMESDLDQIEGVTAGTCKQTENVLSLNKESIEQTVSLSKSTKLSAQNAKPGEKSQKSYLQGNIPSYLRMTSSAANKEIKKKSEIKQRSVTRENNSKSFVKQSDKYSNKTDLKRSATKDLQSMFINGIQSSVTKTTSRDTTFVDDASSPEDLTLTLGYDIDSKNETSNDPNITQVNKFSSQSQNHIKKEINQKCTKSSSKQTAKLPVKSKTIIPRVSVVKSKQATVNIRPRSLTPNDSKPKSIALKQRSQQGIHIGQRSRSTTPGVSDGSCSINDIISKKSLNTEDNQTNGKTTLNAQQTTREDVNVQKQKSTGKGSGVQPRSVIRTDLESKSISLKNQCSQDRSSRSRSTTPSASSVSSDSSCSKTTKLPSKTFDIIPKNVKRIKNDKSSQHKGFKSNQDSKLNKLPERKLKTSKKTIEKEKSINRDFGTHVTSTKLKSNDKANETGQMLKRVSKSKSRSTTPEISSMCSSHSKSSSPNIPQSVKEVPKVKSPTGTHKSNIQSALISSPSGSLSGKGDTLSTNKIKMNKPMKKKEKSPEIISVDSTKNNLKLTTLHSNRNSSRKDGTVSRDFNSRSQSNTPRMSPSSPICNTISNLDQVDSETSRI
ncbi:uncharacterized protein LOC132722260 [Ruditapes philippinarum]|uniref:uncharacterized protein LOC132722260 n=1 Tax=Ruditapes philippinarum TaxID=129788 RepID=UPI00295BCD1C|nr:uncharacterized protein LOC132722260 [Ruditapes philippinarum]